SSSGGTPTGTVSLNEGTSTLGTAVLDGTGRATITTAILTAGSHSLKAIYQADSTHSGSTSASLIQSVAQAATRTTAVSSLNPGPVGQSVSFTATVTSAYAVPNGTVTFFDNGGTLDTGVLDAGGHATISTSSLSVGAHSITAVYSDTANFTGSASAALN